MSFGINAQSCATCGSEVYWDEAFCSDECELRWDEAIEDELRMAQAREEQAEEEG